jgi:hypothetical protein
MQPANNHQNEKGYRNDSLIQKAASTSPWETSLPYNGQNEQCHVSVINVPWCLPQYFSKPQTCWSMDRRMAYGKQTCSPVKPMLPWKTLKVMPVKIP